MTYLRNAENIVRARHGEALSEEQLRRVVPAIFAEEPHASRSDRYVYIPTIRIVEGMDRAGFSIVEARQGRVRDKSRREFTKHMLRFRRKDVDARVGDTYPEAVLINSHDGTSAYRLLAGLIKLICLNGLVVADGPSSEVHVRHSGKIIEGVIEGSNAVLEHATNMLEKPKAWSQIILNPRQRNAFAEAAHVVRFGDEDGNVDTPITPAQLLAPRRIADDKPDLWSTFNVIQENTIRGGLHGTRMNTGRPRRMSTRPINGIDQDVKLNRALWVLAEKMAQAA